MGIAARWIGNHHTHGLQFERFKQPLLGKPADYGRDIDVCLGCGMIRSIDPACAGSRCTHLGAPVFDTVEQEPAQSREIRHRAKRPVRITAGWAEQRWSARSCCSCTLVAWHLGAVRIYKTCGAGAVRVITNTPISSPATSAASASASPTSRSKS